jgi:hypothetical protein
MMKKELRLNTCYGAYSADIEDNSTFGLAKFMNVPDNQFVTAISA